MPLVVSLDQELGDCNIPGGSPGLKCNFWYDNNDMGNSLWGFLDLSNWGVSPGFNCPNAGAAPRSDWIDDGYPDTLNLNYPSATYVCTTSGHAASVWSTLRGKVGEVLTFPVNDPATQLPAAPATPDKYNIIGFTGLRVNAIYDGNDPEAIGTSDVTSICSDNIDFGPTAPANELFLDSLGCYLSTPQSITNLTLVANIKSPGGGGGGGGPGGGGGGPPTQNVTLVPGVDYAYDSAARKITWLRSDTVKNVSVSFTWFIPGTSGLCEPPERKSDPNAKCVITEWVGFVPTGTEPGGGADLGVRAIRLTE